MPFLSVSSPITRINTALSSDIELWVKRDDLIHPHISGNKFRKLKHPLLSLANSQSAQSTVISMGGAWSNHLHALSHAANLMHFKSIGLVRGIINKEQTSLTPTLQDCVDLGMRLHFVSREEYRQLRLDEHAWRTHVGEIESPCLWLPEGGSAPLALKGVAELIEELPFIPDTIIVACGTGATLAGLVAGMQGQGRLIGIAAVQNAHYLHQQVSNLLQAAHYPAYTNFEILHDYHHGGFAKVNDDLLQFCEQFTLINNIPVEPIYTGKLFYAIEQLTKTNFFKPNERVLAIHTGGIQGARGFS
jgi:1-aminocyclopropane-1-carboxylate deaminase